mgnify:CR=1 FL=1
MLDKRFHQYGIQPKISLESVSTQALLEFCLHGQGVLFLPKAQALDYITSGKLLEIHVTDAEFKRYYYFIYHQKKYLTKSIEVILDFMLKANCLWKYGRVEERLVPLKRYA